MKKRLYSLAVASLLALSSMAQSINGCYSPITGESVEVGVIGGNGICFSQLCLGPSFTDAQKIVDNDLNTSANFSNLVTLLSAQGVTVRNNNGAPYPAGYVAGYSFSTTVTLSASVLNSITIATYLNGVQQETKVTGSILTASLLNGTQKYYATFITTKPFNEVRLLTTGLGVSVLSNMQISAALAFSPSCNYSANTFCDQPIAGLATDVTFNASAASIGYTLSNPNRLIDGDKTNYASLSFLAAVASSASVGVLDRGNVYPAGYRAGFVLGPNATNALLSISVLNSITIQTYLYGQLQESQNYSSGAGAVQITALTFGNTSIEKKKLGFVSTKPFNEVRMVVNQLAGLSVAALNIYYAFEEPQSCSDCKIVLGSVPTGKYSGSIQNDVGGIFGLGATIFTNVYGLAIHSLKNTGNAVSPSTTDYATYNAPWLAGVASGAKLTVKNNGTLFKAGTIAGFNYSNSTGLIDVAVLNGITISTYNGTAFQESASGNALIAGTLLGGSSGPSSVSFVTTKAFNSIQININDGFLYGNLGGSQYNLYGAYVLEDDNGNGISDCQEACPGSYAGITAPNLNKVIDSIPCGSTTYDLNTITPSAIPANTVFTWHTGTPATVDNTVTSTTVGAGIYYAAFYDAAHGCYSPTTAVSISKASCPVVGPDLTPTIDFSSQTIGLGNSSNIAIYIQNISQTPTTGTITFTVGIPPTGSSLAFDPTLRGININGNVPTDNPDWTVTRNATGTAYVFTSNPGVVIGGQGTSTVGLVLTNNSVATGSNTTYAQIALIVAGSGGDSNTANNKNSVTYTFP